MHTGLLHTQSKKYELLFNREEPGIAATLVELVEPRIGWVGQLCRRPVGSRKMLPGQSFVAAVGTENCRSKL